MFRRLRTNQHTSIVLLRRARSDPSKTWLWEPTDTDAGARRCTEAKLKTAVAGSWAAGTLTRQIALELPIRPSHYLLRKRALFAGSLVALAQQATPDPDVAKFRDAYTSGDSLRRDAQRGCLVRLGQSVLLREGSRPAFSHWPVNSYAATQLTSPTFCRRTHLWDARKLFGAPCWHSLMTSNDPGPRIRPSGRRLLLWERAHRAFDAMFAFGS